MAIIEEEEILEKKGEKKMKLHVEEAKKVFTKEYLKKIFKIELGIVLGIQLVGTIAYFMGLV